MQVHSLYLGSFGPAIVTDNVLAVVIPELSEHPIDIVILPDRRIRFKQNDVIKRSCLFILAELNCTNRRFETCGSISSRGDRPNEGTERTIGAAPPAISRLSTVTILSRYRDFFAFPAFHAIIDPTFMHLNQAA